MLKRSLFGKKIRAVWKENSRSQVMEKIRAIWKKKGHSVLEEKIHKGWKEKNVSNQLNKIAPKAGIAFFVGWFLASLLASDFLASLLVGILVGIVGAAFFWWLPVFQESRRLERAEAELPFVLLGISIELRLQRPFEKVLEKAGQSDFLFAGREFRMASNEILLKGASVSEALRHVSERFSSSDAKRAVIQLVHAYELGAKKNRGLEVKRIANELLAKQRIAAKAFGGKLALFSLVFITVSAIAPALFQSFVLVGSTFLSMDWTPAQVLLIIALGFPLLDLAVLLLIRLKTPVFLR